MNFEQFLAEAELLARKATFLQFEGSGDPIGYWHGRSQNGPWISVEDENNWLTVYLEGSSSGYTVRSQEPERSSQPLYGKEMTSLPPVDAVFLLGSPKVESYLHRHHWERAYSFNSNFPDDIPFRYQEAYESNCPIYAGEIVAVRGGWHFVWPDGDFEELIKARLVVWTFEAAEPWIEVFDDNGCFIVKQRIT